MLPPTSPRFYPRTNAAKKTLLDGNKSGTHIASQTLKCVETLRLPLKVLAI